MDNLNFKRAVMEGQKTQMYSRAYLAGGKLSDNLDCSPHAHGRIVQCSQASDMEWEGKVDMPKDPDMDCSESYNDVEISVNRAKMNNGNLRPKNVTKFEMPVPASDMNGPFGDDIDKRVAAKRVVLPVETKDENSVPTDGFLGCQPKKRPLKRSMTETADQQNNTCTHDHVKLKDTFDLIQNIKVNKATKDVCITYRPERFSDIAYLEDVPNTKINPGGFGDVKKVLDSQTGEVLIQKMMKKNARGVFDLERNEIVVPLQFPDTKNIAQILGLTWTDSKLTFIMEDAGISLRQVISFPEYCSNLDEPGNIEKIMRDVFTAISHLAKHGITHCDIKPENICLNVRTWVAKLVDFGSSKTLQDKMTYSGITPEYLDPLANKCLYEITILKNRQYSIHVLSVKDDVYSAGLVGLFLLQKAHPMILFFTGCPDYPNNQADQNKKRFSVIKQISEMSSETLEKVLNIPMPDVMKELLPKVLNIDAKERWTSKQAVFFLQEKLNLNVQPPNKLSKQDQQSYESQLEDISTFANVHEKIMDKGAVQRNKKVQPFDEGPATPDVCQSHEAEQRLGIAFKGPAFSAQSGMILMPTKFNAPFHPGQMGPGLSAAQFNAALSQQTTGNPVLARPKLLRLLPEVPNEDKEYADLVESFSVKLSPSTQQYNLPVQVTQPENYNPHPSRAWSPERMILPTAETGRYFNPGSAQNGRQRMPSDAVVFQGISGSYYNQNGGLYVSPTFVTNGNIPNIEAIIQSGDEQGRRKIKGVRRSSVNQE